MPNSYSTFNPPNTYSSKNFSKSVSTPSVNPNPASQTFKPSFTPIVQPRELPRQRLPESFNQVTALSSAFSLRSDSSVSLYRARMENRNVVLRVLNGKWVKLSINLLEVCLWLICKFFTSDFQSKAAVFFSFHQHHSYHFYSLQTLLMPQKGTTSSALHPSLPSLDPIPSCQSFSVLSPCELLWWQLWKSWRTEISSAFCGDADR